MAILVFGFAVFAIFVKIVVQSTQEFEQRKHFKRDFDRFLNTTPPNSRYHGDYLTREELFREYKKYGY